MLRVPPPATPAATTTTTRPMYAFLTPKASEMPTATTTLCTIHLHHMYYTISAWWWCLLEATRLTSRVLAAHDSRVRGSTRSVVRAAQAALPPSGCALPAAFGRGPAYAGRCLRTARRTIRYYLPGRGGGAPPPPCATHLLRAVEGAHPAGGSSRPLAAAHTPPSYVHTIFVLHVVLNCI